MSHTTNTTSPVPYDQRDSIKVNTLSKESLNQTFTNYGVRVCNRPVKFTQYNCAPRADSTLLLLAHLEWQVKLLGRLKCHARESWPDRLPLLGCYPVHSLQKWVSLQSSVALIISGESFLHILPVVTGPCQDFKFSFMMLIFYGLTCLKHKCFGICYITYHVQCTCTVHDVHCKSMFFILVV